MGKSFTRMKGMVVLARHKQLTRGGEQRGCTGLPSEKFSTGWAHYRPAAVLYQLPPTNRPRGVAGSLDGRHAHRVDIEQECGAKMEGSAEARNPHPSGRQRVGLGLGLGESAKR